MSLTNRPARVGFLAVMGLAICGYTGAMSAAGAMAAPSTSAPHFAAINGSVAPTTDAITGGYRSAHMSVEVALVPRDVAGLARTLRALYTQRSGTYHKWLATGQFDARYAPSPSARAAVRDYLKSQGLAIEKSSSPFLVRADGSSQQVTAAFRTRLSTFRDPHGATYFANSQPVEMPATLASHVFGVIGLTNTIREHTDIGPAPRSTRGPANKDAVKKPPSGQSCQTPYPTEQQMADSIFFARAGFPFGYGGGPACSGLTPSQVRSLYGALLHNKNDLGAGVNIGVFELSAYQESDIDTYAHTLIVKRFTPPLVNVNVDGGPLYPQCPVGDVCPLTYHDYYADIEVDADIEIQLAISPDVSHLIVYNAPNDTTGQTSLDEWTKIANDNQVASVSSSWEACENDITAAYAEAENVVFEQMAAQGQSTFDAAGDFGAFDCLRQTGSTIPNVSDPSSQPWVTSVGGTSFENFNPDSNASPAYPANTETVWNFLNLCNPSFTRSDFLTGYQWCEFAGATGGGNSQWWGRPFYQVGPGLNNSYSTTGNGTTQCALASVGTPCREAPDVSANADQNTAYAEYCTGNNETPDSNCAKFSNNQPVPGWFGIGGTSLSSPLWSGIAADRNSYHGSRSGNLNPLLYTLYDSSTPGYYFHDINGVGQIENNNGYFPAVVGYDMATGIGTPIIDHIITATF